MRKHQDIEIKGSLNLFKAEAQKEQGMSRSF